MILRYVGGHTTYFQGLCLQKLLIEEGLNQVSLDTLKGYAILMQECGGFKPMERGLPLVLLRDYLIVEKHPLANIIRAVVTDLGEFIDELNRIRPPTPSGEDGSGDKRTEAQDVDSEQPE